MAKENFKHRLFYTLLGAFALILFWRGIWGLMDIFVFPNNLIISYSLSVIIGIGLLLLIKHLIKHII